MREILLWGGEVRGKSDNILYWLLQQYQYIVLVATCIAIYCIGGNVYCNIFIVRIQNHQYNNNTIVRIPATTPFCTEVTYTVQKLVRVIA
jgi:hypothetical protein